MKKLIIILLVFIFWFNGYSQYPIKQTLGSNVTLVQVPAGGSLGSSAFIPTSFTDTTAANLNAYIKSYAGAIIRTSSDDFFWRRNQAASAWVPFGQRFGYPGEDVTFGVNRSINAGGLKFTYNNLDSLNLRGTIADPTIFNLDTILTIKRGAAGLLNQGIIEMTQGNQLRFHGGTSGGGILFDPNPYAADAGLAYFSRTNMEGIDLNFITSSGGQNGSIGLEQNLFYIKASGNAGSHLSIQGVNGTRTLELFSDTTKLGGLRIGHNSNTFAVGIDTVTGFLVIDTTINGSGGGGGSGQFGFITGNVVDQSNLYDSLLGRWSINGNSGTNPTINFLGTRDNQPISFKVNGLKAGRITPPNSYVSIDSFPDASVYLGVGAGFTDTLPNVGGNIGIGYGALHNKHGTGNQSIAIGHMSQYHLDSLGSNTTVGYKSGMDMFGGFRNAYFGIHTGLRTLNAEKNSFFGAMTGELNKTGSYNEGFGQGALRTCAGCTVNVAIGGNALFNTTSSAYTVTMISSSSNWTTATAVFSPLIHYGTGFNPTTPVTSTVQISGGQIVGVTITDMGIALEEGTTVSFVGDGTSASAVVTVRSGSFNVGVGLNSLFYNRIGYYNTAIGFQSGSNSGRYNDSAMSFIGANSGVYSGAGAGQLHHGTYIGADVKGNCSDCVVLGSLTGNTGIRTMAPDRPLDVNGDAIVRGVATVNNSGYTVPTSLNSNLDGAALKVATSQSSDGTISLYRGRAGNFGGAGFNVYRTNSDDINVKVALLSSQSIYQMYGAGVTASLTVGTSFGERFRTLGAARSTFVPSYYEMQLMDTFGNFKSPFVVLPYGASVSDTANSPLALSPSVVFEVNSNTRGFLAPRMNTTRMNAIVSPVAGCFIFNTDSASYFQYTGSVWQNIRGGSGAGGTVTSVSGTANRITSTGGTTPVIDISASYVGQSSITTVGALTSGSLASGFTVVTVPVGGTGLSSTTAYAVITGGTTSTGALQQVSGVGSSGQVLTSNGAAALPTWQTITGTGTVTSVATNTGTGLLGGTITTTGTLLIDTTKITTRLWTYKVVDSLLSLSDTIVVANVGAGIFTGYASGDTIYFKTLLAGSGILIVPQSDSSNLITNTFSVGLSGGQTVYGGNASTEDLTLMSTAAGSKGNIFFGTSTYDEANNRLGIRTTTPDSTVVIVGGLRINNGAAVNGYIWTSTGTDGRGTWAASGSSGVSSITGTANQVIASASTGAITLSTPQNIATTSSPQFLSMGIGTAASSLYSLGVGGNASTTPTLAGFAVGPTVYPAVNANGYMLTTGGTIVEAGSGTHALLAVANFTAPTVTSGSATVTNTAIVYINTAMSATVSGANYAVWSDAGLNRLDGNTGFGGIDATEVVDVNGAIKMRGGGNSVTISTVALDFIITAPGAAATFRLLPFNSDLYFDNTTAGTTHFRSAASTEQLTLNSSGTGFLPNGGLAVGSSSLAASAQLEVISTTKGFLPPRMTTTQMNAVSSPATGLALFNTTAGVYYNYNGSAYTTPGVISGSFSGVGTATTVFTVTFGGTQPNATYKVNVTPTAALSAALFYVTNKTTTTFDVTYLAGLTGTVTFDYSLYQ